MTGLTGGRRDLLALCSLSVAGDRGDWGVIARQAYRDRSLEGLMAGAVVESSARAGSATGKAHIRASRMALRTSGVTDKAHRSCFVEPIFTDCAIFTGVVNKAIEVNIGPEFEAKAARILRSIPELAVTTTRARSPGADAVVHYAGTETPVAVECKTRVTSAAAYLLIHQAQRLEMPLVVVAAEMTGKARDILSRAGIGSVDGIGNIRLELPGLLLRIAGTGRVERSPTPTRLSGKSGLVAQAMLLDLERSWHVSELSEQCGVSAGLAHRVLRRLEGEDVVESHGAGPRKTRRLSNPAALLDLWAEEQRDRPSRLPAFMLAQTFDQLVNSLCTELENGSVDHALTGSAAAARIAPFVTNVTVAEVWLGSAADPNDICARLGATPVETGPNVVFLQARDDGPLAFRSRAAGAWTSNIFRLYVDLLRDPRRGQEQADHLRQEAIGF